MCLYRRYEFREKSLMTTNLIGCPEAELQAKLPEPCFELTADEISEGHGRGAELGANDDESACDCFGRRRDIRIGKIIYCLRAGCEGGQDCQEMRFARAIIADDEQTAPRVIIRIEGGEDETDQAIRHLSTDHILFDQASPAAVVVGLAKPVSYTHLTLP